MHAPLSMLQPLAGQSAWSRQPEHRLATQIGSSTAHADVSALEHSTHCPSSTRHTGVSGRSEAQVSVCASSQATQLPPSQIGASTEQSSLAPHSGPVSLVEVSLVDASLVDSVADSLSLDVSDSAALPCSSAVPGS